jgi:hypothetical protein
MSGRRVNSIPIKRITGIIAIAKIRRLSNRKCMKYVATKTDFTNAMTKIKKTVNP